MKKHDRQKSYASKLELYIDNDAVNKKHENLLKTYRKKYQFLEPNTFHSIEIANSNINKLKQTEVHRNILSKSKLRKSQQKKSNTRVRTQQFQKTDRFTHLRYDNSQLSTKNKLQKITKLMSMKPEGQVLSLYKKIRQNNEQYLTLVHEWKKMNIFDDNDLLIQKLIESYTSIIQDVIKKHCNEVINKLDKYQQIIQTLAKENEELKKDNEKIRLRLLGENAELQFRILGEYQKNQWSTLIFNELQTNNFHLEYFVHNSKFFKRWAYSLFDKGTSTKEKGKEQKRQDDQVFKINNIFEHDQTNKINNIYQDRNGQKKGIRSLYNLNIKNSSFNNDQSHVNSDFL